MNAIVSIDRILSPETVPAPEILTPAILFGPGGVESIISKLEAEVRAIDRDISTPEGRETVKSLAYKVARSKTALDDMGKGLAAGIKAQAATIDAERRIIRDRLDALKEEVRGPLTAWEDAEKARVDGHENALVFVLQAPTTAAAPGMSSEQIGALKAHLEKQAERDWQEFSDRALEAFRDVMPKICSLRDAADQRERDAAELAELRRLKAEREEADRKAAEAAAAAEQARLIEEARAAREAQQAEEAAQRERERAEQDAERHRQNEERAARNVEAAKAAAVEQERQRAAAAKAAEEAAQQKREANKRHRAKIEKAALDALTAIEGVNGVDANLILAAIIAGTIPHVSITY